MSTIKELVTKFGFEIDEKPLKDLDAAIVGLKGGLIGVGASVAAAAGTLYGLVKSAAHAGDEAYKMSQRVGIGVEELQRLGYAAKLSDVDAQDFGLTMMFLNRALVAGKNGSAGLTKSFKDLGISAQELKSGNLTADAALKRIADKFQKMPDGPKKTAAAMELFGRSGAKMIPLLNGGSEGLAKYGDEAERLGIVISKADAMLGEEFNDSLTTLSAAFRGITQQVGLGLLPVAKDAVEAFTEFLMANRDIIKENLSGFVKGLTTFLKGALRVATIFGHALTGLATAMGGVETATLIVIGAIGLLSSASLLFGVGKLVQAVYGLATAFTVADAAAALIPIAIGAAVVLLLVIFEDIVAFFQGRNSITGIIVEKFGMVLKWFQENFPNLAKFFKGVFDIATMAVNDTIAAFTSLFGWVMKVGGAVMNFLSPIMGFFGDKVAAVMDYFGAKGASFGERAGSILGAAGEYMSNQAATGSISGVGPSALVAGGSSSADRSVSAGGITFNFPAGTDPSTVAPAAERGVLDALDSWTRQASRAGTGAVAY